MKRSSESGPDVARRQALCADQRLHYLVLAEFAGRHVATDGVWYLYDCQAIRETDNQSEKPTSAGSKLP